MANTIHLVNQTSEDVRISLYNAPTDRNKMTLVPAHDGRQTSLDYPDERVISAWLSENLLYRNNENAVLANYLFQNHDYELTLTEDGFEIKLIEVPGQ